MQRRHAIRLGASALLLAGLQSFGGAAELAVKIPPLVGPGSADGTATQEVAVFAGGCFWGVQGVFQHTRGVVQAVSHGQADQFEKFWDAGFLDAVRDFKQSAREF